jgi:hypothetical protein
MRKMGNSGRVGLLGVHAFSVLLLAAQLVSVGHLLLVSHVTCPEHGDLIHAGQGHEASHGQRAAGQDALGRPSRPSIEGESPRAENVHDHCLICTSTHERFALIPPASLRLASIEVSILRPASSHAGPFAPVDLIVLSPKNSPPAA